LFGILGGNSAVALKGAAAFRLGPYLLIRGPVNRIVPRRIRKTPGWAESGRARIIAPASVPHNRTDTAQEGAMNRAPTLGEIVRAYKAVSTRLIRQTANADFAWQRNYYEHIVRSDESLNRIRQYIRENPSR
jgi:hypothetical protein